MNRLDEQQGLYFRAHFSSRILSRTDAFAAGQLMARARGKI